ncbi:MAG: hypothetical protein HY270_12290 [Deltaproteobacteria bacterium]|nr:hypothetical protein [Deltaproteobacteria bacterium]
MGESAIDAFAGTGEAGYAGDDGPAIDAELRLPSSLAVGSDGTLFIADYGNHKIRIVTGDGTMRRLAGDFDFDVDLTTALGFEALFRPERLAIADDESLYVLDRGGQRLQHLIAEDVFEPVESASCHTHDIATFSDGTLLALTGKLLVREQGAWLPLFPEEGWQRFTSITTDGSDVIAYDNDIHQIVRIDNQGERNVVAGNGTVGSFGDGGPADGASFSCTALAFDSNGRLFLSDPLNGRVAMIDTSGDIDTFAGGANGSEPRIIHPAGIAIGGNDDLYVADEGRNQVLKVTSRGTVTVIAGTGEEGLSGDQGPATAATLNHPTDIAVTGDGKLFVADSDNWRIRRIDETGTITTVAVLMQGQKPRRVLALEDDSLIVATEYPTRLLHITVSGEQNEIQVDTDPTGNGLPSLIALAIGVDGRLALSMGNRLLVGVPGSDISVAEYVLVDPNEAERPIDGIAGGIFDSDGHLILCDETNRRILRVQLPSQ